MQTENVFCSTSESSSFDLVTLIFCTSRVLASMLLAALRVSCSDKELNHVLCWCKVLCLAMNIEPEAAYVLWSFD